MSKIPEILANIEETLVRANIRYCTSYMPNDKSFTLTIFGEDERSCRDCVHWNEDLSAACHRCDRGDAWEPIDNNG